MRCARRYFWLLIAAAFLLLPLASVTEARSRSGADVLSFEDIKRYREIFRLQQRADWRRADKLIARLQDRILMGHVLQQRYMHPTGWRSTYEQLHNWMRVYADHPDAERVYRLATKRRPSSGWKPLRRPHVARLNVPDALKQQTQLRQPVKPVRSKRSAHDRRILRQVYRNVFRDRMTITEKMLAGRDGRGLSKTARAEARAALARGHISNHRFDRAIKQGDLAARGSGGGKRLGAFYAGLAFWARDQREEALQRFRIAAGTASDQVGDQQGAIDFWHARAALSAGQFQEALSALEKAARHGRSFYGLIARTQLAHRGDFSWQSARLSDEGLAMLAAIQPIRRALALTEVSEVARADQELKRLSRRVNRKGAGILVVLSEVIDAPATAYRLARIRLKSSGERFDTALFPMPSWQIDDTVPVGRALLMAVARRESGFNADARSRAGARGLMQLMPGTAGFIARMKGFPNPNRAGLNDPETSLKFGQAYLAYLGDLLKPKNCLIHVLAAYNAGPGNVQKWKRRFGDRDDPLLFLELMGSRETRHFIKDVIPAYWIYRGRMQMPAPSLDSLAQGRWPIYVPAIRLADLGPATGEATDAHR